MCYLLQGHSPTTPNKDLEANPMAWIRVQCVGTWLYVVGEFFLISTHGYLLIRPEPIDVSTLPKMAQGR
jgi:hypothetical protein